VPPEHHPAAWFAVIKGVKRYVRTDPSAHSDRPYPAPDFQYPWLISGPCINVHRWVLVPGVFDEDEPPAELISRSRIGH
jgi:hypothetical protein